MKKQLLIALFSLGILTLSKAQDTVFIERFDPPSGPDSVTTYNVNSLLTSHWNDTTALSVSAPASYHTRVVPFDSVIFETDNFSTVGKPFVQLKFNHICKINFGHRAYIQASNDGGTTWVTLTGTNYLGNSPGFGSTGYFNEFSYPNPTATPYWGGLNNTTPPTNAWWAEESFDLKPILGGVNGYANCKIRFIAADLLTTTLQPGGWFIDNVIVQASTCELEEPKIDYNLVPYGKPVGAMYNFNEPLRLEAKDYGGYNQGVDSVVVWWRLNGGAWQATPMNSSIGGACPDSSDYTYTFSGILLNDTIDWYVEIYDCACPNVKRDPLITATPTNYYTFWRDPAPPAICGSVIGSTFPLVVSTFPFIEDFETWGVGTGSGTTGFAHRGTFPTGNPPNGENWIVAPNAVSPGFAWSVRNSPTATTNTGPDADNTPGTGTKFVYAEASQGNPVAFTQLITPCIDLQAVGCGALEFYYHMYGQNIDLLRVDVDTGDNVSAYVNNVWRAQGEQQTSSTQPYRKAYVSLEQFAGKIVRIRFIGRKNTATAQDKNDIAIDDIKIFEPVAVDLETAQYFQPENGYCSYSNAEPVIARFQSLGCVTQTALPVAFRVEYTPPSGSPVTNTISRDTIFGNFSLGIDSIFTFGPTADLSAFGTYNIYVYTELSGDLVTSNDTLGPFLIEHNAPFNNFPFHEDFDGPGTIPGEGNNLNPGTISPAFLSLFTPIPVVVPTATSYAWYVKASTTPSAGTGPISDFSGKGNYLYTEGNYGTSPISALFVTECISLAGMTNPIIDFRYYMYGSDIGAVAVQIVKPGENFWSNVPGNLIANNATNAHTDAKSPWNYWAVDLSAYAGQTIKMRIIAQKTGTGTAADVAIDNINIFDKGATDVGIEFISPPTARINVDAPQAPGFTIRNFGSNTVSNIPITYTITPLCGPNAGQSTTYNVTYSGSIAPGATATYVVPAANMPTYPVGSFEICGTTGKSGDTHTWNDTYCVTSVGWPQIYIQNGYFENFDACNEGNESGFWHGGDYRVFKVGTPNTGAGSAPNAYSTKLFGTPPSTANVNIYPNTDEYLYAPRFVGFDTIVGGQLWFKHKFGFTGGAGVVEFLTSGNQWLRLGFSDPDDQIGLNWHNDANSAFAGNQSAWSGSSANLPNANGWVTSMWPLNNFNNSPNALSLRWHLFGGTGGTSEWSIDDVQIIIPPQNSASPVFVETVEYIPIPDVDNHLRVRIQNTGAKILDSCLVQYSTNGPAGPYSAPELVVFNPPLVRGAISPWYEFQAAWAQPSSGPYNVCVVTSRPNNKQDNLTNDDSTCTGIIVPDKFELTPTDSSYCNNFDNPAITDWIALNWPDKQGLLSWEKGSPNQAPFIGAHSAPNAWMTNLTTNYRQRDSSSLFTPFFVMDTGQVYEMEFWHNFKTELYHDGGSIEFSYDGWQTYKTLGYVLPSGDWFNTTHVTAMDILRPGWTGESGGWINSKIVFELEAPPSGDVAQFRFRFASDQSFEYQGWAIDDFCITRTNKETDIFIGVEEEMPQGLVGIGNVIPNPTSGVTIIPYVMNDPAPVKVNIYNVLGQLLNQFEQQSQQGLNQVEFDVTNWKPGMYVVSIEVNGEVTTRKVIVE